MRGTAQQLAQYIGRHALYALQGGAAQPMSVRVVIEDVREAYGRRQYLIAPLEGIGHRWVSDDRLVIHPE